VYQRDTLSLIVDDAAARLSEEELSERLETQLAGLNDLERESFDDVMRTVGSGAQAALPGVVQGASMGAAAGPWGALIGGLAGGAMSLATSNVVQGRPAQPAPPPRPSYTPPPRPSYTPPPSSYSPPPAQLMAQPMAPSIAQPTAMPAPAPVVSQTAAPSPIAAPVGTPNPAGQLLWAINDPRVQQAIAALIAGPLGRQQVPVGQTSAPPAAFLNLLNVLAAQAAERAEAFAEGGQDAYLRDAEGDYAWDVVNPEARARALLVQLQQDARARRPGGDGGSAGAWLLESGLVELDLAADAPFAW
jgi:hypothetical protein